MGIGLLGKNEGMMTMFDENGTAIPSSVLSCGPCTVTQVKIRENDGYNAVQIGYGDCPKSRKIKPYMGQFKVVGNKPLRWLREFRLSNVDEFKVGQEIRVDVFQPGERVDVVGISKGKGFAGVVKRHGFGGGPKSHGQSDRLRAPGSIGGQGPQRVLRGMRMAGHMGVDRVTIANVKIFKIIPEQNLLILRGSVPGVKNSLLIVKPTVKTARSKPELTPKPAAKAAKK